MPRLAPLLLLVCLFASGAQGARQAEAPRRVAAPCWDACPGDRLPVWSPDGRTIAFQRRGRPPVAKPRGYESGISISTVQADGGGVKAVGERLAGVVAGLTWSPDRTKIAYVAGGRLVVRILASGTEVTAFSPSEGGGHAYNPSWSPDSQRLVFERSYPVGRSSFYVPGEIRVARYDGGDAARLAGWLGVAGELWARTPLWSPEGSVAYLAGPGPSYSRTGEEIWVLSARGHHSRLVSPHAPEGVRLLGWSPGGERLYYLAYGTGSVRDGWPATIHSVTLRGEVSTYSTILVRLVGEVSAWLSPDATKLLYLHYLGSGAVELWIRDLEPYADRRLADGVGVQARPHLTSASWSPDGSEIAYLSDGECATWIGVHVIQTFGTRSRRLTNRCRRTGSARADRLRGTVRPDALYGLRGTDSLDGGAGPDFLQGGPGNDYVSGAGGDDRLYGGPGRDRLAGGGGWDLVYSRDGVRDVVACGSGTDDVLADRLDRVAADCEFTSRR